MAIRTAARFDADELQFDGSDRGVARVDREESRERFCNVTHLRVDLSADLKVCDSAQSILR